MRFVWHDRHSEEENLINLVVERNTEMPNLVYLRWAPPVRTFLTIFLSSGAFLRLHHHNRRLEFYTPMGSLENRTLLWPIRCLFVSILMTVKLIMHQVPAEVSWVELQAGADWGIQREGKRRRCSPPCRSQNRGIQLLLWLLWNCEGFYFWVNNEVGVLLLTSITALALRLLIYFLVSLQMF